MEMPGRMNPSIGSTYRFGMSGQMKDNEFTGQDGAHTTAMFWEYDSRIGRRWNLDPAPVIGISDYVCFANNPIVYSDVFGDKIKLKGSKKNKQDYVDKLNSKTGGDRYSLDKKGKYVTQSIGPENSSEDVSNELVDVINKAIGDKQTVTFKLVRGNKDVLFDSFKSGKVDLSDLDLIKSGKMEAALIGHFTAERFAVNNYEKNKKRIIRNVFRGNPAEFSVNIFFDFLIPKNIFTHFEDKIPNFFGLLCSEMSGLLCSGITG